LKNLGISPTINTTGTALILPTHFTRYPTGSPKTKFGLRLRAATYLIREMRNANAITSTARSKRLGKRLVPKPGNVDRAFAVFYGFQGPSWGGAFVRVLDNKPLRIALAQPIFRDARDQDQSSSLDIYMNTTAELSPSGASPAPNCP
jgi:hypothetical protein